MFYICIKLLLYNQNIPVNFIFVNIFCVQGKILVLLVIFFQLEVFIVNSFSFMFVLFLTLVTR